MKMFATLDHTCSCAPTRYTLHGFLGCFLTFSLFVFYIIIIAQFLHVHQKEVVESTLGHWLNTPPSVFHHLKQLVTLEWWREAYEDPCSCWKYNTVMALITAGFNYTLGTI